MTAAPRLSTFCLTALLLLAPACRSSQVVARVGRFRLTAQDAKYRDEVVHVYYPGENREGAGLHQLIEAYTDAQIIENNGRSITPEILAEEEKRIDEHTRAPEVLEKIKKIFGRDHDAYLRDYVLPVYAQREVYYGIFLGSPAVHAETVKMANDFRLEAEKSHESLHAVAKRHGYKCFDAEVDSEHGFQIKYELPKNEQQQKNETAAATPALEKAWADKKADDQRGLAHSLLDGPLRGVRPGDVAPSVIDLGDRWMIMRYLKRLGEQRHLFETVSFAKASYQPWLAAETAKVQVVTDPAKIELLEQEEQASKR